MRNNFATDNRSLSRNRRKAGEPPLVSTSLFYLRLSRRMTDNERPSRRLTRNRERERRRWMLEETRWGGFSFEIFGNSSLGVASFSRGILVEENFVYNFPVIYFFFFSNIIFIRISLKRDKIGRWKLNVETEFWGKREGIAKRFGNSW